MKKGRGLVYFVAVFLVLQWLYGAYMVDRQWAIKESAQKSSNRAVEVLKERWNKTEHFRNEWDEYALGLDSTEVDQQVIVGLVQNRVSGVVLEKTLLSGVASKALREDAVFIKSYQICAGNGNDGLTFVAKDLPSILAMSKSIEQDKRLSFEEMKLSSGDGVYKMSYRKFCVNVYLKGAASGK